MKRRYGHFPKVFNIYLKLILHVSCHRNSNLQEFLSKFFFKQLETMATPVSDDSSGAQTQGTALFPVVSFHAAHMFINSPLLHPP